VSTPTRRAGRCSSPTWPTPATPRWLAFSPPALAAGTRAVFGFPLQVGAVRLGAMNLYRDRPGKLSDDQHADALVMADVAAQAVLAMQANAPLDTVATELEAGANFHLVEHQASGMVATQLGISVGEALVRLRAYAFSHDLGLTRWPKPSWPGSCASIRPVVRRGAATR
jgi:hypothetical protein